MHFIIYVSICGPFAVLMSYLSEFHGATHRSRVVLCVGLYFSLANITLPGMAWAIIPTRWILLLPNGTGRYYEYRNFSEVHHLLN